MKYYYSEIIDSIINIHYTMCNSIMILLNAIEH